MIDVRHSELSSTLCFKYALKQYGFILHNNLDGEICLLFIHLPLHYLLFPCFWKKCICFCTLSFIFFILCHAVSWEAWSVCSTGYCRYYVSGIQANTVDWNRGVWELSVDLDVKIGRNQRKKLASLVFVSYRGEFISGNFTISMHFFFFFLPSIPSGNHKIY